MIMDCTGFSTKLMHNVWWDNFDWLMGNKIHTCAMHVHVYSCDWRL